MPEWFESIPQDIMVEHQGQQVPLRDHSFVRESKDLPSFVKTAFEAHREVGARIPIRTDGKPESIGAWQKEHLPKLYKAGILPSPGDTPEDYVVEKPSELPDEMWSKDQATELQRLLHKHRIPKSAVNDLIQLHMRSVLGSNETLKTSMEEGIAALKQEFGSKYDERSELARRLAQQIFKTPEELDFYERIGLGNHPAFLSVLMRLAPLAQSDSSFMKDARISGVTGEDVRNEVAQIMSDTKHPMYEGYRRSDPKVLKYIEELYRKAYGTGTQDIGAGIVTTSAPQQT